MLNYTFGQTAKTWVGLLGALLTAIVPAAVNATQTLPSPWPEVIAAVLAFLTAVGIYKVPNAKAPRIPASATPSEQSEEGLDFPWPKY